MALLLLRNEADCLVPNMETEPVSSHLPPELNRSPITARAVSSSKVQRPFVHPLGEAGAWPLRSFSYPWNLPSANGRLWENRILIVDLLCLQGLPPIFTFGRSPYKQNRSAAAV